MICKLCGRDISEKYGGRTRCNSCNTRIRRYRCKLKAIEYLGGKCSKCGWTGDSSAFEFHHTTQEKKDFSIGNVSNKKWELILKELNKCELLCSNCHRIEHSKEKSKFFIDEVRNYNGRILF